MFGWPDEALRPRHAVAIDQGMLFPVALETFEVQAGVSADEMARWHKRGWLSFAPAERAQLDDREWHEVRFVAAVARSGLSDAWIDRLLAKLPKPYCYDPGATLFCFATDSWVQLPKQPESLSEEPEFDVSEELDGYLNGLAADGDWSSLRAIRDDIDSLLDEAAGESEAKSGEPT